MTLYFAVFGDIHGRIALMLTLSKVWQDHNSITLDGILQVGDMGAFPDHSKIDRATRAHAKRDSDELEFVTFVHETEEAAHFAKAVPTPILFVRGNHEDFDYLEQFQHPQSIDPFHRLSYLPDGHLLEWYSDRPSPLIGGFGGKEPRQEPEGHGWRKERQKTRRKGRRGRDVRDCFSISKLNKAYLELSSGELDILMTHAGPACPDFPTGSTALRRFAERLQPRVHLFGHHHVVVDSVEGPGGSLLVGLEHLDFNRDGTLKKGSWGILEWSQEAVSFEMSTLENCPWMASIRHASYRHLVA